MVSVASIVASSSSTAQQLQAVGGEPVTDCSHSDQKSSKETGEAERTQNFKTESLASNAKPPQMLITYARGNANGSVTAADNRSFQKVLYLS